MTINAWRYFTFARVPLVLGPSSPLGATLLGSVPAAATTWHRFSDLNEHYPALDFDARGNLWMRQDKFSVSRWPYADHGWPSGPQSDGWEHHILPPGYRGESLVVDGDNRVYVVCKPTASGRELVLRLDPDQGNSWEELPVPQAIGILTQLAVDSMGTVWLGGERREVFRLEGSMWVKEVTPVPLHTKELYVAPGGLIWARAASRRHAYVLYREHGVWRRAADLSPVQRSALLWGGPEQAVVRVRTEVLRCRKEPDATPEPWFDSGGGLVAVDAPDSAWVIRDRTLYRIGGSDWNPVVEAPFSATGLRYHRGHLFAGSDEGTWVLTPLPPAPPSQSTRLGLFAERPDHFREGHSMYGTAVLRLKGRPHLYVARHEVPDCVLPLRPVDRPEDWASISRELGLDQLEESFDWLTSYALAVATADLNGDGTEDVVLSTMYDGCRFLRNARDKRLIAWTEESGLQGFPDDIAMDVDLLDADADGDLDLYVSALHARDKLYLNNGAGVFREGIAESGMRSPDGSSSSLCRDVDLDGDTDVLVATAGRGLYLHENLGPVQGRPRFATRTLLATMPHPQVEGGLTTENLTGMALADFNGDDLPDLIIGGRTQPTKFLWNRGGSFVEDRDVFVSGVRLSGDAGVTCFDPDGDGDWDVAITGAGGTYLFENQGDRLVGQDNVAADPTRSTRYSTGSALVDFDGDGDLDLFEVSSYGGTRVYENRGQIRPLIIRVEGPPENRSAVGAIVRVLDSGTGALAAPTQEIPGGSGYASHDTKEVHVTGLDPAGTYRVHVKLPSGREVALEQVAGEGRVEISMGTAGAAGIVATAVHKARVSLLDVWGRKWWMATGCAVVMVGLVGWFQTRRRHTRYPWYAFVVVAVVALVTREFQALHLTDPSVFLGGASALTMGLISIQFAPRKPVSHHPGLVADLALALRTFEHNAAPRRALDRLRFFALNLHVLEESRLREKLDERLQPFHNTVLSSFTTILESASVLDLDASGGSKSYQGVKEELRHLERAVSPTELAGHLADLTRHCDEFRNWMARIRPELEGMVSTRLQPFLEQYSRDRRALHGLDLGHSSPHVMVRLTSVELTKVLDVLVDNAMKARSDADLTVRIEADRTRSGRIELRVSDNGPGVPTAIRSTLFKEGVSGSDGSGFGLFAASQTLERFGGSIRLVETDPGQGAVFLIELAEGPKEV